jgi:hypothetical protein
MSGVKRRLDRLTQTQIHSLGSLLSHPTAGKLSYKYMVAYVVIQPLRQRMGAFHPVERYSSH